MRLEFIEIEKIERYLLNEMAPADKENFEKEIQSNTDLKAKVEAQKIITAAIRQIGIKQSAKRGHKLYKMKRLLTYTIIALSIIVGGLITLKIINSNSEIASDSFEVENSALPFKENDSLSNFSNQLLDYETFTIETSEDTVIENKDGLVIYIPEQAFSENGPIELMVQSAFKTEDILYSGLSTTSNGEPLETGGMFYIDALKDGKRINIIKDLEIMVPTNDKKESMALYTGEKNSAGDINWVKPKPLVKDLCPVNILSLDFYPPLYENTLNGWGYDNKTFNDSLYYSFAFSDSPPLSEVVEILAIESSEDAINKNLLSLSQAQDGMPNSVSEITQWNFSSTYLGHNTFEITMICKQFDGWGIFSQKQPDGAVSFPTEFNFTSNQTIKLIGKTREYGAETREGRFPVRAFFGSKAVFKQKIKITKPGNLTINYVYMPCKEACFPPTDGQITIKLEPLVEGINPASIKTIWTTDFNNTILATKEFEKRMPFIHRSCDQSVLDLYLNNLDKGLSEIDSLVIPLVSGKLKSKFESFAKRRDGKVNLNSKAVKKLNAFYKVKSEAHVKAIQKTNTDYWRLQNQKDSTQLNADSQSDMRNNTNTSDIFQKEFQKNLCKVYEAVNYPYDCKGQPVTLPKTYYTATISNIGWHNIDRKVYAATLKRQSTTISYNGKSATLTYNEWVGKIANFKKFDRIHLYNIPIEFNSYIKLSGVNGSYKYKLNEDIEYKTVVLAWTENNLFFAQKKTAKGADLFKLEAISRTEFNTIIRNQLKSVTNMSEELNYIENAKNDQKRINKNDKLTKLKEKIRPKVFPCSVRILENTDNIQLSEDTTAVF